VFRTFDSRVKLEYWKRGERVPGERREFSENNKYEL
jgi:hypothetical protein